MNRLFNLSKYKPRKFVLLYLTTLILVLVSLRVPKPRIPPSPIRHGATDKNDLKKHVAIIGSTGNVGSFLTQHLISAGFIVTAFDKNPSVPSIEAVKLHSDSITSDQIKIFDAIVFLGGCTGRSACAELSSEKRFQENSGALLRLIEKMKSTQHLITASTSAVSEGNIGANEKDTVFVDLLDEYSSSMYNREVQIKKVTEALGSDSPKISILRFGTVVGLSPAQRTDLLFPSLLKSAYTKGVLTVQNYDSMRSFLSLDDLVRSVEALLLDKEGRKNGLDVWNLASFHASILKVATTVASKTGATLDILPKENTSEASGFTISPKAFEKALNFTFKGSLEETIDNLDKNIPESITPKGPHVKISHKGKESIPCPVCGSRDQQLVLDLGTQPFANDFQTEKSKSMVSPRFPLRLVRCRICNHYHLSHVASREDLFQHYLYQSGTSATLQKHFEWLAMKVVKESGKTKGSILELACNDGSQLNQFRSLGWNTYGVDPAENLAQLAREQNHTIQIGFWPLSFPELPVGNDLTAIVAQNVFAHVPDPVSFLRACAKIMGPRTKLYIQTSQCNMQQLGQFDTVYHEHISFFTGHSFFKASQMANLHVVAFETTPIHGESCLVTMELKEQNLSTLNSNKQEIATTMAQRLQEEQNDGITDEFFGDKFMTRANSIRQWILSEISIMKQAGYQVGAYGAAAKGMTLLHFMLDGQDFDGQQSLIDWVLDDGQLKQNTFCPGTSIPLVATEKIKTLDSKKPVAVVVLAWNFLDEIIEKLSSNLVGIREDFKLLVPFPKPHLLTFEITNNVKTLLREMPYFPTPIPNPIRDSSRRKVLLLTHQRNEELLMPFFIIQHAPMFDNAILIDFESNDKTLELIEKYAPPSWKVVNSTTGSSFDAVETDTQVMEWEKTQPNDWHIGLTTTEFLVQPNFRAQLFKKQIDAEGIPMVLTYKFLVMVGDDSHPLKHFSSLIEQRHQFMGEGGGRYLHLGTTQSHFYTAGRHFYENNTDMTGVQIIKNITQDGFITKWSWTPWPEGALRKVLVGDTIPQSNVDAKLGWHHTMRKEEGVAGIEKERQKMYDDRKDFPNGGIHDLCDDEDNHFSFYRYSFYAVIGKGCISSF